MRKYTTQRPYCNTPSARSMLENKEYKGSTPKKEAATWPKKNTIIERTKIFFISGLHSFPLSISQIQKKKAAATSTRNIYALPDTKGKYRVSILINGTTAITESSNI